MPVEASVPVVLAVEKSHYKELVTELIRFRYFQFEEGEEPVSPDIVVKLEKLYSRLASMLERLNLQKEAGIIDTLIEGYDEKKVERIKAENIEELVIKLERTIEEKLNRIEQIIKKIDSLSKELEEQFKLREAIRAFSKIKYSLDEIKKNKRTYIEIVIANRRDYKELKRSLEGKAEIYCEPTEKDLLLCAIVSLRQGSVIEEVDRVLKAFEVTYARLPESLPKTPNEAFSVVETRIKKLEKELSTLEEEFENAKRSVAPQLPPLYEAVSMLRNEVMKMRVPKSPLRRVKILAGYVPESMYNRFIERFKGFIVEPKKIESGKDRREREAGPTLIRNGRYAQNFETITLTQGAPSIKEVDPTPLISIIFPAFFGLMFGDIGHGLLLALVGLLLRIRGYEELRRWGIALISFGISSIVIGTITGEAFGLPIYGHEGVTLSGIRLPLLHVGELSAHVALELLGIALVVGVMHIAIGLLLDFYRTIKNGEVLEGIVEKLPSLILYVAGVFYAIAFIYAGYDFSKMWLDNPTPLGVPTSILTMLTLPILIVMSVLIIASRPLLAKREGHSIAEGAIEGVIEWLLKIIEYMANTMSYARLAVLLLVHVALLHVVNMGFQLGLPGLGIIVIGNIGVVMLEGLIVYIQDLRLHVYEWFTKFYEGAGKLFKPISLKGKRIELMLGS